LHAVVGAVPPDGSCTVVDADGASGAPVVQSRGPVVVTAGTAPVRVATRALGDAFIPVGTVAPNTSRTLGLVPIAAGPWAVQIDSSGPIRVCPAG
jgi:hypothetical protein